tara:strand:+ start:436 stop:708 length:273 start_codon:yes stop_codon:yes gene_type:complete
MVKIDDEQLTTIVGIAVFITFMLENWVNHSVAEADETDTNLLKALATPPPASVFAGMALVTVLFSVIAAKLSDEMVDRVVASSSYIGNER